MKTQRASIFRGEEMLKRVVSTLIIITMLLATPVVGSVKVSASINKSEYKTVSQAGVEARKLFYNHNSVIVVKVKSKSNEPQTLFDSLTNVIYAETNNPNEGDYMKWDVDELNTSYYAVKSGSYYYYDFTIKAKYLTTVAQRNTLDERVKTLISELKITNTTSQYDKIKKVYDYVTKNVKYVNSTSTSNYSAYSAMVNKKAVCQGYASLLYKIYRTIGISTRLVAGNSTFSGEKHGWNIVKIGKYYYNVDGTWDSTLQHAGKKYSYFLKGDSFKGHRRWKEYKTTSFYNKYPMAAKAYDAKVAAKASTATKIAKFKSKKVKINAINRSKVVLKKVTGAKYQIKYSTVRKFKAAYSKVVKTKKTSYKFKKLKNGITYYVKARAFKKIKGKKYYTKWSAVSII